MKRQIAFRILAGATYRYLHELPKGCRGALYRVHNFVLDVPSYQMKVLVEAITGPDVGLLFTCTTGNFAQRYERVEADPSPVTDHVFDATSRGKF